LRAANEKNAGTVKKERPVNEEKRHHQGRGGKEQKTRGKNEGRTGNSPISEATVRAKLRGRDSRGKAFVGRKKTNSKSALSTLTRRAHVLEGGGAQLRNLRGNSEGQKGNGRPLTVKHDDD